MFSNWSRTSGSTPGEVCVSNQLVIKLGVTSLGQPNQVTQGPWTRVHGQEKLYNVNNIQKPQTKTGSQLWPTEQVCALTRGIKVSDMANILWKKVRKFMILPRISTENGRLNCYRQRTIIWWSDRVRVWYPDRVRVWDCLWIGAWPYNLVWNIPYLAQGVWGCRVSQTGCRVLQCYGFSWENVGLLIPNI